MAETTLVRSRRHIDVWNEVPLVPQLTGMSCWAAAAAMIIGWRDSIDVDPERVAASAGRWKEYRDGLHPTDTEQLARAWGLTLERRQDWTIEQLCDVLERYGPVWFGEASPGLHSIVITGMAGDGSPDATRVRINDPWPIGRGERYSLTWREFLRNFRAATDLVGVHANVLHAGGRGSGPSGHVHFEETRVTTRWRPSAPESSEEDVMRDTELGPGMYDEYASGNGAALALDAATATAGEQALDTSRTSPDPLARHGGTGENVYLTWSEMPRDAAAIDVVVHLHGYSASQPNADLLRKRVAAAGLDLTARPYPTLAIVPRGRRITEAERREQPKANPRRVTFPALTAGGGEGVERLIAYAIGWLTRNVLGRGEGEPPPAVRRLIFTAHSGGGAAVDRLLHAHTARPACNPQEVHLFDAVYGEMNGLASWLAARLAADRALNANELGTHGGGLRILYRPRSARRVRALEPRLPAAGDPLRLAYRIEETTVPHSDVARHFAPVLLGSVRADLALAAEPAPTAEGAAALVALGLGLSDDVRAWLASPPNERATHAASVSPWIAARERSAIELIDDAAARRRFLETIDWARHDFPGNGPSSAESDRLFNAMARIVSERRVPQQIAYRDVDDIVETVPGSTHRLHPEAVAAFVAMREAAGADGVTLTIGSGWRSRARQRAIAESNPNRAAVAQRVSAHSYGLAIDLRLAVTGLPITEMSTRSMPNIVRMYRSPVYKWMALYGREHGWFPYRREPWHWEYNPPGFKERFETGEAGATRTSVAGAAVGRTQHYGAPVGLFEHYRDAPPHAATTVLGAGGAGSAVVARDVGDVDDVAAAADDAATAIAHGEVPGDIDPRMYEARSLGEAIRTYVEWFRRRRRFTIGVQDPTFFPHSAICQLTMRFDRGAASGTGFYIAPNRLLTAAHNIVMAGRTLVSVEVAPGKTNDMSTFGSFRVSGRSNFVPHPRYVAGNGDFDLAVIKVSTPPPAGEYFEMEELRMSPGSGIIVCGYAAEGTGIDRNRQNMDVDTIRDLFDETFTYALHARRGTSGSPTYYVLGNEIKAVGVLSRTRDRHTNLGCRLTDGKIRWVGGI